MNLRWVSCGVIVVNGQIRYFHEEWKRRLAMETDEDGFDRDQIVSRTCFYSLAPSSIGGLSWGRQNVGKYVLLRVLDEGYSREDHARFMVVDNQEGEEIALALYNYPPDQVFPQGTYVIIKEPYCKLKIGLPFIRCDCPTDVIVVPPSHAWYNSAKSYTWRNHYDFEDPYAFDPERSSGEWRARGNELFYENQMVLARESYLAGYNVRDRHDPNRRINFLNLLQVQLNLGFYEWVIEYAIQLPDEEKALYRKGKAYYMLRRYKNALSSFWDTINLFGEKGKLQLNEYTNQVNETVDMLKRAETRLKENRSKFSIDYIINESKENPLQEIDCADFCVHVEVTEISDQVKGLILGTKVKKGDVVMISKSWATAFRNERDVEKDATEMLNLDVDVNVDKEGLRAKVVSKLTELVYKNPKTFKPKLFKLYAGASNSKPIQLFCDSEREQKEPICDVNRINDIYVSNGFTMRHAESRARTGSGLFYLPSFLNHSSKPNVDYKFYNDVMVVTALEDIAPRTELTINHVILQRKYQKKTGCFKKPKPSIVRTCPKCPKKN